MKLKIGEIKSQVDQMNLNMILKSAQAQDLLSAIEDLVNDGELEGKAFTYAKQYFEQIHMPIVKGLILVYDEIKKANKSYLQDLYNQVEADDGYFIDTSAIEMAITQKQAAISQLEEKAKTLSQTMPSLATSTQNFINQQNTAVVTLQAERQKVIDFDLAHGSHYNLANQYLENVSTGISSIRKKQSNISYLFRKIDTKNLDWAKALNNGWKLREKKKEEQKKEKVDYKKLNSDFWNRTDGYFDGKWWQDPKKLEEAAAVLKAEAEANGGISLEDLISQYSGEEANLRLYVLQALANAYRTGNYDEDLLNALIVSLYGEGTNFDSASKVITADALNILQKKQKKYKGKKFGDWLENGGRDLLLGIGILFASAIGSNQATIDEQIERVKQNVKNSSTYEGYKERVADNRGGVNVPKKSVDRPTWRQSEKDVGNNYPEYDEQKSFKNREEVPYGEKGSSRPDFYKKGTSIEVKNYNLTTSSGRNSLVNTISKQVNKRIFDLPSGTKQTIIIDVRGQNVSNSILKELRNAIIEKCNTDVKIQFMR